MGYEVRNLAWTNPGYGVWSLGSRAEGLRFRGWDNYREGHSGLEAFPDETIWNEGPASRVQGSRFRF